ncbi:MAG TPA: methyl-accepting chemotaxis protein, partial [Candidatus Competibacter sp.]|nr:methyl-accepting chemotaxis protein [Candidatus Competibacter sp.]
MRLKVWGIKTKLTAACTLIVLLGAGIGVWNLTNFRWAGTMFQVVSQENLPALDYLTEADRDMQQALVAERSLIFVRQASEEAAKMRKAHEENLQQVKSRWQKYRAIPASDEERQLWPEFERTLAEWEKVSREVLSLLAQDSVAERKDAIDISQSEGEAKFEAARSVLNKLTELRLKGAEVFAAQVRESVGRITYWTVAVLGALLVVGGLLGFLLARSMVRVLGGEPAEMAALTGQIARGDLTVRFADTGKETGIYAAMHEMVGQLKDMVGKVTRATGQVNSAAAEIAQGSADLAQRTEEQASALEETASSMEELTGTVKQSAEHAGQANQLASAARSQAEQGGQVVERAVVAMSAIDRSSKQIADIIGVIDEIAFQTNLLALNAAVEAARAREQGRGFAVGAGEGRKLA